MCQQAGELLLREHVFIHLEQPVDKLNTLVQVRCRAAAIAACAYSLCPMVNTTHDVMQCSWMLC